MKKILFAFTLLLCCHTIKADIRLYEYSYYKYIFASSARFNISNRDYTTHTDIKSTLSHITKDYKKDKHPGIVKTYVLAVSGPTKNITYAIGVIDTHPEDYMKLTGWYRSGTKWAEHNNFEVKFID